MMNILVCIKQVPESDTAVTVAEDGRWLSVQEKTAFKISRFDEFAVEEAILIKAALTDVSIDILSVGPERAEEAIRRAIGMGADNGIHLVCEDKGYLSPFTVSAWIAAYAAEKGYDLILFGVMSEDSMQGQVGPMTAERLGLPCATAVVFQRFDPDGLRIRAEREIEGGYRNLLELSLPAVLTVQSGINRPRYPSLSNLLRANRLSIEKTDTASFPMPEPRQAVVRTGWPQKTRTGRILGGTQAEKADELVRICSERGFLR